MTVDDTVYFSGAWDAAQGFQTGQSVVPMSRDGERQIVNKEWAQRSK